MKRTFLALCAAFLAFSAAYAVPAKPGKPLTFTQSDGKTIQVKMMGDERLHSFVTSDGLTVGQAENGDFFYRTADGLTNVMAHNAVDRSQAEQVWVNAEAGKLSLNALSSNVALKKAPKKAVALKSQVPTMGSPKVPILLVQYSDKKMANTKATLEANYKEGSKSAYQYFKDQSDGQYTPQFEVWGIYTLPSTRSTYGANDSYGDDKGVALMVADAVKLAVAEGQINWKDYDNDGDGECDVVIVVYAGVGEAQAYGVVPSSVWPCQWSLSEGGVYGDGPGALTYNSTKIDKFAVFNEITGSNDNSSTIDGIGTFCHEFSHCLGLPDFYDTEYTGKYFGMGDWSLLDNGCYCDDGYTPCGYTAYEKNFMNWMTLATPEENTQYSMLPTSQGGKAYKIVNDADANEYYIVENRQQTAWDKYIPAQGMMVNHVTYSASAWDNNEVNNYSTQRMTVIPADNTLKLDSYGSPDATGEKGDLYPYNGNNSLTDSSTPAAKVYTGSYMGKPITDITNTNGTISFWYMKEALKKVAPELKDATNITGTSFTANWTAGTNCSTYTLYVNNVDKLPTVELLEDADFSNGLPTGWNKSSSGTFTDEGYFRLGTSKVTGSVTSPKLTISDNDGTVTVKVTCKNYGTDTGVALNISLLNASGTKVASKSVSPTSSDATYNVVLTGGETGSTIVLENGAEKKRVMLKEVKIYSGDASAEAAPAETGDADFRTITGITDTTYTVTGLTAGATFTYKVKAQYTDGSESAWCTAKTVTLQESSLKGDVNGDGKVDTSDISALINKLLGTADWPDSRCDVNGDGSIDTSDISALINILLG